LTFFSYYYIIIGRGFKIIFFIGDIWVWGTIPRTKPPPLVPPPPKMKKGHTVAHEKFPRKNAPFSKKPIFYPAKVHFP
jgi:hypothetical protein